MKNIFSRACVILGSALALSLAACGGNAHAQTVYAHAQFGPNQTVDLLHARMVDMTPGAQRVVDASGALIVGAFPNDSDFFMTDFQQRYILSGTYVYYNATAIMNAKCVSNKSVIAWLVGPVQTIDDACAFFNLINSHARR